MSVPDNQAMNTQVYPPSELASRVLRCVNWVATKKDMQNTLDLTKLTVQCDDISKNIHHFVYDGVVIRRKNKLVMSFNCLTCKRENILALNNVDSKIDRNIPHCSTCNGKFTNEELINIIGDATLRSKIESDALAFEAMDDVFKARYNKKLMTPTAFENIRKSILGYQYMKFTHIENIVYVPYYRTTSSLKSFEPMFYDASRDTIEKPMHVTFECDHCAFKFTVKDIMPYRNKKRILCKACEVEFGPTKPRYETNINGDKVIHRTMFQHKFIKYCNKHGILCEQGPKAIPFKHANGESRVADVHYYLPETKTIVDVVGNLEFQKEPSSKTIELYKYAQGMGLTYVMLYPKNYVKLTRSWKKAVEKHEIKCE